MKKRYSRIPAHKIRAWISGNFKCKERGDWINICNPFDDDKKYRLGFNLRSGIANDFRPGHATGGTFVGFVKLYKSISTAEAIKEVCGTDTPLIPPRSGSEEPELIEEKEMALPDKARLLSETPTTKLEQIAHNYLVRIRSIPISRCLEYGLHYDSESIIFPYIEFGILVYWMKRYLLSKGFLYPKLSRDSYLYGIDMVEHKSPVVIVESAIDCISIGEALAKGGARLSIAQINKLRFLDPEYVILAPDRDNEGIKSLLADSELLSSYGYRVHFCIPPEEFKDWNDMLVAGIEPSNYIAGNNAPLDRKTMIRLRLAR